MRAVFLFAVFLSCFCLVAHGNLFNFANMIKKITGKNAVPAYTSYGCHCGLGGSGQPVDATDRCCRTHDCCYIKLEARGCKTKTGGYKYSITNRNVVCAGSTRDCGRLICECDKAASLCFKNNLRTYDNKHKFKPNVFCRGTKPAC